MKNARLLVALAAPLASFACNPTTPAKGPEKPVASAAANKPTTVPVAKHPLLQAWQGPYDGVPPWKSYTQSVNQFEAAIDEAIAIWLAEVDAIVANDAAPTFDNTLLALEMSGQHLDRITRIFFTLTASLNSPEVQKLSSVVRPKLSKAEDKINFNKKLFARIESVHKSSQDLRPEQKLSLIHI